MNQLATTRANHWIKPNHQCRIPKRWIAFDTEANTEREERSEVQTWRMGAAVRWREDLKNGDKKEEATFDTPEDLWRWVTEYCRPGTRTVCMAHNLSYDVRIADVFNVLPKLGWRLEWCNLDRNVSAMTWRSEHGTLVLCDLFTWIPKPLSDIGDLIGLPKLDMPGVRAARAKWEEYCLRDAELVYAANRLILEFIRSNQLGNWQPTGAGFAYSIWRHKFMNHKVLVHDNMEVIADERAAMHTGRAEAWRHGNLAHDTWYEVDLRSAYVRIAAECDLPTKYKFSTGKLTLGQYEELSEHYRVLCVAEVDTELPVVPHHTGERTIWPVGVFQTTLWDTEVNELLGHGGNVRILRSHCYTRHPVLQDFARWALDIQDGRYPDVPDVIRAYVKHGARALLGRLALKAPTWEYYGENPMGENGISYNTDYFSNRVQRLMHVGNRTLLETARREGRDSLPQITGWVMAECRVRLWQAMDAAGIDNLVHVDTDCVLVNHEGLRRLRQAYGAQFDWIWQIKAQFASLIVYGPRNLRAGRERKVAGVPRKAREVAPNQFVGERWRGLATDMAAGRTGAVTIFEDEWTVKRRDPRRGESPGDPSRTIPVRLQRD